MNLGPSRSVRRELLPFNDCLVAPLKKITNKGDLLVFSPTVILHPVSLRALWIEDQTPAIVHNPSCSTTTATAGWTTGLWPTRAFSCATARSRCATF
jgi:hypothetical protein